ncbi:SIR2 family protein [Fibrivirga algicola]|uniref:SIR2-like domain-containing protein n=1 Tax=Fibrivirga algicola TaxID=2950420 RepID=A0ABX0QEK6_9BACT|nr:SIR2 family protein [Fibrivirga algicola]NID09532.1 hypothetical protein [Fibrivirga algicola]
MNTYNSGSERIQIGSSSRLRLKYLNDLKEAYKERRLVLFLGAGVSLPYGIPTWKDLVTNILINRADERYEYFFPAYRPALASWLSDKLGFSPTLLARVIRYQIDNHGHLSDVKQQVNEYRRVIRDALYRTYRPDVQGDTTLAALVRIIEANEGENRERAFPAIVNFNFDNLLEKMLTERGIGVNPVYKNSRVINKNLSIIHVNGYLPNNSSKLDSELIFTEDEFNKLTFSQLHWAVSELTNYLRNYTVLFVGLSMSDPNLRRLLDGTCLNKRKTVHYVLRKDYVLSAEELEQAKSEIEARAQEIRARVGEGEIKSNVSLTDAIETMLKQAHKYDRRLFKDMGVGTLWLNDYNDIPQILEWITHE